MLDLAKYFRKRGVILEGHFKLTSGRHSNKYVNKDAAFSDSLLFGEIYHQLINASFDFTCDVMTGPAIAGAVLAAPIALFTRKTFVYPEKINGEMVFRRGYDKVIEGQKVLIIEDIITTGSSVIKTIKAIEECGGFPAGVVAIWNRSGWTSEVCPTMSLIEESVESWTPEECPLCYHDVPLQDPKAL